MTVGVAGIGAYAPAARLSTDTIEAAWGTARSRGVTTRAVPAADEDPLTMAAAAGERALSAAGIDAAALRGIVIGTTTPPVEEEALVPRLASFLAAPAAVAARQLTGSTRAGVAGLAAGADLVAEADGPVLVVAADAPRGAHEDAVDHAAGAGAAGVLLSRPEQAGGSLGDRATVTNPAPGTRFRPRGETETRGLGVTQYDRDVYIETVSDAVDALGAAPSEADAIALQAPDGSLPYRAAGALGVETDRVERATTVHHLGDTGAASPLLGLAVAVADGATDILLVGYGSGSVATATRLDASGVSVQTAIEAGPELSYPAALRVRGDLTGGPPDGGGAYVSVPSWRRTIPQRHRLVAGRCRDCGEIAYPPTGACERCGTLDDYEDVRLPGTGTVEAATEIGQGGAPPEFAEQQARSGSYVSAIVGLDCPGGGTVSAPFQVVSSGDAPVAIGDRVTGTIRRLYTQEAVTRYTVKMTPAE
jgi:hydroxymethylglutaryl-CoA synthase